MQPMTQAMLFLHKMAQASEMASGGYPGPPVASSTQFVFAQKRKRSFHFVVPTQGSKVCPPRKKVCLSQPLFASLLDNALPKPGFTFAQQKSTRSKHSCGKGTPAVQPPPCFQFAELNGDRFIEPVASVPLLAPGPIPWDASHMHRSLAKSIEPKLPPFHIFMEYKAVILLRQNLLVNFPAWVGLPSQQTALLVQLCTERHLPYGQLLPEKFTLFCVRLQKEGVPCPHLAEIKTLPYRKKLLLDKFCFHLGIYSWSQITCTRAIFFLKLISSCMQECRGLMLPRQGLVITICHLFQCTSIQGVPLGFLPFGISNYISPLQSEQFCNTQITRRLFLQVQVETPFPKLSELDFVFCAIPASLLSGWIPFFKHNQFVCIAIKVQGLCAITKQLKFRNVKGEIIFWVWSASSCSYPGWSQCFQLAELVRRHKGVLLERFLLTKPLIKMNDWFFRWNSLIQERTIILNEAMTETNRLHLCMNMEKSIQLLRFMPVPHIQQLLTKIGGFNPVNHLNVECTLVYVLLSKHRKRLYVGETGGKVKKRCPILRFLEHVKCANKKTTLPHAKNNLYRDMKDDNPASWIMVPVCLTSPQRRLCDEQRWIQKLPFTYNKYRNWKPWNCCTKEFTYKIVWAHTHDMVNQAQLWCDSLKLNSDVPSLLHFLKSSHHQIPKNLWIRLFHRIKSKVSQLYRFNLPISLVFKYPPGTDLFNDLKAKVFELIYSLPLAIEIKQWLSFVVRWVPQKSVMVSNLLKDNLLSLSTPEMARLRDTSCLCEHFPTEIPRHEGCVIFRDCKFFEKIFSPLECEVLSQNLKNCTLGPWIQLRRHFDIFLRNLFRCTKRLPWHELTDRLCGLLRQSWLDAQRKLPASLQLYNIRALKASHPALSFQVLDKNPGTLMILCCRLACRLHFKIMDHSNHKQLRSFSSVALSQAYLSSKLHQSFTAVPFLPHGFVPKRASGAAPHAYYLIKNKTDEYAGDIKLRTIYSYAKHPYKHCCKLIGRCLTLLIKSVVPAVPCFEMLNMQSIVPWCKSLGDGIRDFQRSTSSPFPGRLIELDVKEMFPSIKPHAAIQAMSYVFQKWVCTKRYRTRNYVFFAIHKHHKQLDALGKRDACQYINFTWNNIVDMVRWELFKNNLFRINSTVLKQKQGVPIGGPMSAQLASLYCIACELHKTFNSPLRCIFGPVSRFRDNIFLCAMHDLSTNEIKLLFSKIYNLQFTLEQCGPSLVSLEVFLRAHYDTKNYFTHFIHNWKQIMVQTLKRPVMQVKKWVSPNSINAKYIIKCYVPSACEKCVYYSHSTKAALRNLLSFASILTENGYPPSWWKFYVNNITRVTRKGIG